MQIKLLGTRGSHPAPNPKNSIFGGNTSCVLVRDNEQILILDAGTGILNLDLDELKRDRIDILLTHLHMDHIQGLGFFKPFFEEGQEVHLWGPASSSKSLKERLTKFFSPPLFPVLLRNLPCDLHIHELGNSSVDIQHFQVSSNFICHPGPTVGFRVSANGASLCYLPDHEPALGWDDGMIDAVEWLSGSSLAIGADLLIHDAQYSKSEYLERQGWGHSSMEHAIQYANTTHVKHLILFHHDPATADEELSKRYQSLTSSREFPFQIDMAVEGSTFEL